MGPQEFIGLEERRRADVEKFKTQIMRCRLDHRWLDDGQVQAILTITLANGHMMRFTAECDPNDLLAVIRASNPDFVGFSLGKLWKGVKKAAKSVANSKVFKMAGTALAVVAPALGPLAPAALAAAGGMKAATALLAAKSHKAAGNAGAATKLVSYAANIARTPTVFNASASLATNAAARAARPTAPGPARPGGGLFGSLFNRMNAIRSSALTAANRGAALRATTSKPPLFNFASAMSNAHNARARAAIPARATPRPAARAVPMAAKARALPAPKASTSPKVYALKGKSTDQKIYALLLKPA